MVDGFGTIKEGTGPGMLVGRRVVEEVGAIKEGTCPMRRGLVGVAGGIDTIDDCIGPVMVNFAAIEEGSGPVTVGLVRVDGGMEMTEVGMTPLKVRTSGVVCVDAAIFEGSGPVAEAGGRTNSARRHQLSQRATARMAATSAVSSVCSSTSSSGPVQNQHVIT